MRSARSGGLIGMANTNANPRRMATMRVRRRVRKARQADVPATINLQTACANAYAAPIHRPRTTKVYSVSLPVLAVSSQWSNVSRMGQSRQISSDAVATNCEARECIGKSISPSLRIQAFQHTGGRATIQTPDKWATRKRPNRKTKRHPTGGRSFKAASFRTFAS